MAEQEGKFGYAMLTTYVSLYKARYGKLPKINKYREKWAMNDVVDSVGYERGKELLEYYFRIEKSGHPLQWFYYNFDKLDDALEKKAADAEYRQKIRQRTKEMVEEATNEH